MRPRLLDLFCGAGLAADGYVQAGWEVVGVDIEPQPDYPYAFIQGDALAFLDGSRIYFDAIHASPPVTGKPRPWGVYHVPGDSIPSGGRTARNARHAQLLMGVDRPLAWAQLKEGFPPAYARHVGRQLLTSLEVAA